VQTYAALTVASSVNSVLSSIRHSFPRNEITVTIWSRLKVWLTANRNHRSRPNPAGTYNRWSSIRVKKMRLYHFAPVRGAKYCNERVCMSVCLSVCLSAHISIKISAVAEMGNRLATIDMGRKVGAAVPIFVGGAGSPCNTMSPGSRPTFVPSCILIHPTVWSQ